MRVSRVLALVPLALAALWVAGGGTEIGLAGAGGPSGGVEASYHGQMGYTGNSDGGGAGMLEKWCALPNFSFAKEGGIGDGSYGWTAKSCNDCHIGAAWNPTRDEADCTLCHEEEGDEPTIAACMTCHWKDTSKRGDVFDADNDVHIAADMLCHDCHARSRAAGSDHQFLKGTAIDTTEPTMEGTLSCTSCHDPDDVHANVKKGGRIDKHLAKVACETCHTGKRPAAALQGRSWTTFVSGKPYTWKRPPGWAPIHKWYDRTGPGAPGNYDLPILGTDERRGVAGAQIFPFNEVTVTWFVETSSSDFDDIIVVKDVKAADANGDGTTTLTEMRATYSDATLVTQGMTFSINHGVLPAKDAAACNDCHGRNGWLLDWDALGYDKDPKSKGKKGGSGSKSSKGKKRS